MNYERYEMMLLFAIYSILGWIINASLYRLIEGKSDHRSICKGPFSTAFGLGAILVVLAEGLFSISQVSMPLLGFCLALIIGLCVEAGAVICVNGISGTRLINIKWYHPIGFGIGGMILLCHLNPLILAILHRISPWVHLVALLIFWLTYISQLLDGIEGLIEFRIHSTRRSIQE